MRSRPHCVVVGLDGHDFDVLVNLVRFYQDCGFQVSSAHRIPHAADLLVIQRGPFQPGVAVEGAFARVHIYDYVGHGTGAWAESFPNARETLTISLFEPPATGVVRSPPPVIPALWTRRLSRSPRRVPLVHIGHRKPGLTDDPWQAQIDALERSGQCVCFGDGWSRGGVSHHTSQSIYRDAAVAIGIQYPFQRGKTISGRMWQAPLNGCLLLSEAIPEGLDLPGVHKVNQDYLEARGAAAPSLSTTAESFWNEASIRLAQALGLRYRPASRLAARTTYLRWVYKPHLRQFLRGL